VNSEIGEAAALQKIFRSALDNGRMHLAGGLFTCWILLASTLMAQQAAGWSQDRPSMLWESTYVKTAPALDGKMDDAWKTAKATSVPVREAMGGDHPQQVVLRALHTDDSIFISAAWADSTRSGLRDPYVWNPAEKRYDRPSRPDDQFAIEFPMKGGFAISMLTVEREYTADVWHWKAGRGDPVGWVDDKYHVISRSPVANAKEHKLHSGRRVFIARVIDAGRPPYALKPEPVSFQGESLDSFAHQEPAGSLADVRGKGAHDGKGWFLEMGRKFNAGHGDDAVIDPMRDTPCAIAILNDELYEEHSVSTVIHLRLSGGPGLK
jgi:hypothetical protein